MKKIILAFLLLLAVDIGVSADNGTLSITNVQPAAPGYTGSLDIALSGSSNTYRDFQLDITQPEGLTYMAYAEGELLDGHSITRSDQGGNKTRLTGYTSATKSLTAANGTLLTIYFTVSGSASGTLTGGLFTNIHFSDADGVDYTLTGSDFNYTVSNSVTLDEDDTEAPIAVSDVNVTVKRTLKADTWNSLCLPFDMTAEQVTSAFGSGAQLAAFNGYTTDGDNITVNFSAADAITAHTPCIVKVSEAKTQFTVEGVNITAAANDLTVEKGEGDTRQQMIGNYIPVTIPAGGVFLSGNTFKISTGSSRLKGFRAYFSFTDVIYDAGAPVRSFSMDITDDTATGIGSVDRSRKGDSRYYDLNGRPVKHPATKGVYIQNGKKFLMK